MSEDASTDLSFVTTDDLFAEMANRSDHIICGMVTKTGQLVIRRYGLGVALIGICSIVADDIKKEMGEVPEVND